MPAKTEDFIITFGEAPVSERVSSGEILRCLADGLIQAAEAGATAVIQPGGSIRDQEVIEAADARGIAMAFTGVRVFRH